MIILGIIFAVVITVVLLIRFTTKELGRYSAIVRKLSTPGGWSGVKTYQVDLFCEKLEFSQTFSIEKELFDSLSLGDTLSVNVYTTLGKSKTMSIHYDE